MYQCKQQLLNFFPLPQGHGSLRPTFVPFTVGFFTSGCCGLLTQY
jgi:hypothetical protein